MISGYSTTTRRTFFALVFGLGILAQAGDARACHWNESPVEGVACWTGLYGIGATAVFGTAQILYGSDLMPTTWAVAEFVAAAPMLLGGATALGIAQDSHDPRLNRAIGAGLLIGGAWLAIHAALSLSRSEPESAEVSLVPGLGASWVAVEPTEGGVRAALGGSF